jgi:hypothetical protein
VPLHFSILFSSNALASELLKIIIIVVWFVRLLALGRPRRRWVDNIKMDLGEIGRDGRDWIELAQDRDRWRALVNTVMDLRVP